MLSWRHKCFFSMFFPEKDPRLNAVELAVKILAASNEIRCERCSQLPSSAWAVDLHQLKHELFLQKRKKFQWRVWKSIRFVIFKLWKMLCNWIDYYWNSYFLSRGYSWQLLRRQCKIKLSRDNLVEEKVLESSFCRLSESLIWTISGSL